MYRLSYLVTDSLIIDCMDIGRTTYSSHENVTYGTGYGSGYGTGYGSGYPDTELTVSQWINKSGRIK